MSFHPGPQHAASGAPAWRAQVSVESSGKPSHHSAELPFLFDGLPLNASAPLVGLQAYLARFVKTGNPNGEGLPHWPRFLTGRAFCRGRRPTWTSPPPA